MSHSPRAYTSKGIDVKTADQALRHLEAFVKQRHPEYLSEIQREAFHQLYGNDDELCRNLVENFFRHADLKPLADLLSVPEDKVRTCLRVWWIVINLRTEKETHLTPDGRILQVQTFVAIGPSEYDTGLCALGSQFKKFSLRSGEALHTSTAEEQKFSGKGNSFLLVLGWEKPSNNKTADKD